jgi:hypothetical protein
MKFAAILSKIVRKRRGGPVYRSRLIGWFLAPIVVLAIAAFFPWSDTWREIGPLGVVLAVALLGLLRELAILAWSVVKPLRTTPIVPADSSPPDGRVGITPIREVQSDPNPSDPRFGRFRSHIRGTGPFPSPTKKAIDADPRLAGRANPWFLGRIAVISVFIGKDGRSWSDAELAQAHAALLRAGAWLQREAIRWRAPVNVNLAATYFVVDDHEPEDVEIGFFPQGDDVQPFEAHAMTKALASASRAAVRLGFSDAVDLVAQINPRLAADARVWLLHPRQAGHSLAIPPDETALEGVSLAVCYAREANFPEPLRRPPYTDPVTIVHELLHLFGASDKYGVSLRTFPAGAVTSREIMRLDESSLSRSRVDPLTAREIGWPTSQSSPGRSAPPS